MSSSVIIYNDMIRYIDLISKDRSVHRTYGEVILLWRSNIIMEK